MSDLQMRVLGGAWISGSRHGLLHSVIPVALSNKPPDLTELEPLCAPLPLRYGRFNLFTKTGFLAIALTLKDAGIETGALEGKCGIIFSTKYESISTDSEYYQTTHEAGGSWASASLFPYTLPVIAAGEAAAFFKLRGPTFSVGEDAAPSRKALQGVILQLHDDPSLKMLAGWIEVDRQHMPGPCGAVFTLLEAGQFPASLDTYDIHPNLLSVSHTVSGAAVTSLIDLVQMRERCSS